MSKPCSRHRQQGAVLPLLAVGMLTIIGIVGLSIDVGHVFLNKTRLQNALDSAALSGARTLMLSSSPVAASTDARAVFDDHLSGEMANLDAGKLVLQYSNTLVPFVAGGSDPNFVRAIYKNFTTDMSFSGVLPNVDESMSIAGSAVAGPIPVGYKTGGETCDIAPLAICPIPGAGAGDSDCSDGSCFGYVVGKKYPFYPDSNIVGESGEEQATASTEQSPITCEVGSIDCEPALYDDRGSFLLSYLGCTDDICIRENLAGSFNSCLTQNASLNIEQGASPSPIMEGLKTRFGAYHSTLSAANYPPDVVVTQNQAYGYHDYKRDVATAIAAGSSNNGGVLNRRVLTVPVVNCEASAADIKPLLGIGCIFLVEVDEGASEPHFEGQFVNECEASGERGESIPANSEGPMEITLYKDPDNDES